MQSVTTVTLNKVMLLKVAEEIAAGDCLTLSDASRIFSAGRGKRVHSSTFLDYIRAGCRTKIGDIVKLEAVRFGSRWLTSRAALARFMSALTNTDDTNTPDPPSPAGVDLHRARAAVEKLAKA